MHDLACAALEFGNLALAASESAGLGLLQRAGHSARPCNRLLERLYSACYQINSPNLERWPHRMRLFAQKPVAVLALFLRILPERAKTLSEPAVQNTCTSPSGLQTRMSSSTPPGLQRRSCKCGCCSSFTCDCSPCCHPQSWKLSCRGT